MGVLDSFVGGLDYAMVVVTVAAEPHHQGCLVGFHTQTSIDPPRLLVCLSKANATTRAAQEAEHLGVQLLPHDRRDLAELFGGESGDWTDKLAQVPWRPGPSGVPLLTDAAAWLVGRVLARHDLGDHVGMLLEPLEGGRDDHVSVLTFQQAKAIDAGHPA
jgi:flavin reductase (DIM6/NTAB) family NADH-FMN oxidoreductase RutF